MTLLLEKAFDRLKTLTDSEQDIFAAFILERLEEQWDKQLAQDFAANGKLRWMLDEVESEVESGKLEVGGFDGL